MPRYFLTGSISVLVLTGVITVLVLEWGRPTFSNEAQAQSLAPGSAGRSEPTSVVQDNKYSFILFWKQDDQATRTMWQTLQTEVAKYQQKAFKLNITSPAEKAVVDKYGVSRSPMP